MAHFRIASDLSSLTFAVAVAAATYLGHRCYTSPHKDSPSVYKNVKNRPRTVGSGLVRLLRAYQLFVSLSGVLHLTFTVLYPLQRSFICPHADALNKSLFTWSEYTSIALLLTIVGGTVRVGAYAQLGESFTFELSEPKKGLVTGGLYRYVRHPSYGGGWVCTLGLLLISARFDGGIGCYIPSRYFLVLTTANVALVFGMMGGLYRRVAEEEAMLHNAFGREWEEYSARTTKFIPGLV